MNCRDLRMYLSAFADGELDTEASLRVLDHAKMCPACAGRIAEIQSLKATLERALKAAPAPQNLRERLRSVVAEEPSTGSTRRFAKSGHGSMSKFWVPISMAATVVLSLGLWQWTIAGNHGAPGLVPIVKTKLAADARVQHRQCSLKADLHHRASQGWDLRSAREKLSAELKLDVAAPDLERWGYRFHSADVCGILGRQGGHIMYQHAATGRYLSLFTLDRILTLSDPRMTGDCAGIEDVEGALVGWQGTSSTYLLCGQEAAAELCNMSASIR